MADVIRGLRIAAAPASLDALDTGPNPILRIAPDEAFVVTDSDNVDIDDPYAIVEPEAGYSAISESTTVVEEFLARTAGFSLKKQDPGLTQGMAAGLAVKIWRDGETCRVIVPTPFAAELDERFRGQNV